MKLWLSDEFRDRLRAGGTLPLAWSLMMLRADGQVYGFTTHVEDIVVQSRLPVPPIIGYGFGAVVCLARAGMVPTDVQIADTLAQNNLDITSLIGPGGITQEDIRAGKWKNAQIEVSMFFYDDLDLGNDTIVMGSLGEITIGDLTVKTAIRGITNPLEQNMNGVTSGNCDAKFGDARCGVDLEPLRVSGTIRGAAFDRSFSSSLTTQFTGGEVTFTSGAMAGETVGIKQVDDEGIVTFAFELYPGFADDDTYTATPGCNHLLWGADGLPTGDCVVVWHNARRFRGFRVPGEIAIAQYGGQADGTS